MEDDTSSRRRFVGLLAVTAAGVAGCAGGGGDGDGNGTATGTPTPREQPTATPTPTDTATATDTTTTEGETPTETTTDGETPTETTTAGGEEAGLRVAHVSPDAPNVDVYVDGDAVLEDVPFGAVSDYLSVAPGTYTVTITAAGDESTVAFEGDVTLEAANYTVAAVGELTSEDTEFRPLVLEESGSPPASGMARVTLVHAAPDAPAVDVTAGGGDVVVFDGVPFGETATAEVEAGDYTLQVRGDTESNDGDVVAEFDVSVAGGTAYTAFAQGYLSPDDEPTDESFDLNVVENGTAGM